MFNNQNREAHLRRYLGLSVFIFALVALGHALRIAYDWMFVIAGWPVLMYLSWLALIVTVLMVIMGLGYLKK